MADARLALALAAIALAALSWSAVRPARGFAQQQQDEDPQSPRQQRPQASDAMQGPNTVMDRNGPDHVDMSPPPSITMNAVPGYGNAPLSVGFFVNTVDPEGRTFVSYVWNFGDGQVSIDPPLTFFHTYQIPGNYVATVNATTSDGRTATAYVGITVRPGGLN
jgi:PKD repeat protein